MPTFLSCLVPANIQAKMYQLSRRNLLIDLSSLRSHIEIRILNRRSSADLSMASFFQAFFSSQCVGLTTEALFASDFFIAKNVCVTGKCHVVFTSDLFWGNVLISC